MKVGDQYETTNSGILEVIEFVSLSKVKVRFILTGFEKWSSSYTILKGQVKDSYYPSVCGKGWLGEGEYKISFRRKLTKAYQAWRGMLRRCYHDKTQERQPTYKGVSVCQEWLNFQNFAEWYEGELSVLNPEVSYQIDKDILVTGNKIYSPLFCCLVTQEINSLLTYKRHSKGRFPIGVSLKYNKFTAYVKDGDKQRFIGSYDTVEEASLAYITEKETYIKIQAEKAYKNNEINTAAYNSLLSWKV